MAHIPLSPATARLLPTSAVESADPRACLFRETAAERATRWLLGTAYACHPKRVADLPFLVAALIADAARGGTRVPDPAHVYTRPDTFGGLARDISPDTVIAAAKQGFFPWSHVGPLKWWTRENRMILPLGEQRIGKNVKRLMRKQAYRVTFDEAFDDVIKACAAPRKGRLQLTWITPRIMRLYSALHEQGHAHSFEVWSEDGRLVGGGYGLAVGRAFITESQFSRESNTSKIGFATLNHHLAAWGYILNDGKDPTPALTEAGFRTIPRAQYEALLKEYAKGGGNEGPWRVEADLATIAG